MEERECIEKFLIYNASLVISGVKPSATVTIKRIMIIYMINGLNMELILKIIDISYINLRETNNALIILIYNENKLKNYIFEKENKNFYYN